MQSITLEQFVTAFQDCRLSGFRVAANGDIFHITAEAEGGVTLMLSDTGGLQPLPFRNVTKAIETLHKIGVRKMTADISEWSRSQRPRRIEPSKKSGALAPSLKSAVSAVEAARGKG